MKDAPRGGFTRRSMLAGGSAAFVAAGFPGALRSTLSSVAAQSGTGSLEVGTVGDFLNLDPFVMSFVNYPHMETAYDQLMRLGWKVFLPISLLWIFLISGYLMLTRYS